MTLYPSTSEPAKFKSCGSETQTHTNWTDCTTLNTRLDCKTVEYSSSKSKVYFELELLEYSSACTALICSAAVADLSLHACRRAAGAEPPSVRCCRICCWGGAALLMLLPEMCGCGCTADSSSSGADSARILSLTIHWRSVAESSLTAHADANADCGGSLVT